MNKSQSENWIEHLNTQPLLSASENFLISPNTKITYFKGSLQ